jgi:O-antigen/teichoic acid export membrane protein
VLTSPVIHSDNHQRVFSLGAVLAVTQVLTMLVYFLGQRWIVSGLSHADYGAMYVDRRIVEFVVLMVVDLGLNLATVRLAAQNPEHANSYYSIAFVLRLALALIVLTSLWGYSTITGNNTQNILLAGSFALISSKYSLLKTTLEIPWRVNLKIYPGIVFSLVESLLFFTLVFIFRHQLTVERCFLFFVGSASPGFIVNLWLMSKSFRLRNVAWARFVELIKVAIPLYTAGFVALATERVDALILPTFLTNEKLGALGAAYTAINSILIIIPLALIQVMTPIIAGKLNSQEKMNLVGVILRWMFVAGCLFSATAVGLSTLMIDVYTKGSYSAYTNLFVANTFLAPSIFLVMIGNACLSALGRERTLLNVTAIQFVCYTCLLVLLVPHLSIYGVVGAKFVATSVAAIIGLTVVFRELKFSLRIRYYVSGTLLFAITMICAYLTHMLQAPTLIWSTFVAAIVVVAIAFLARILTKRDAQEVLMFVRNNRKSNA